MISRIASNSGNIYEIRTETKIAEAIYTILDTETENVMFILNRWSDLHQI